MAHYEVPPNFDVEVLSQWVEDRLYAYNEQGWTHKAFSDRLSSFMPDTRRKSVKRGGAFTKSPLEHIRNQTLKGLSEERVQALAAYIKEDMSDSNLPKTLAGVKKWLSWKTAEQAAVEGRKGSHKKKTLSRLPLENDIESLKKAMLDIQRRVLAIEARHQSTAERPKKPMTILVQEILEANGVSVLRDEARIRGVLETYPEAQSLLAIVLNYEGVIDPYSSVCLIGAMNELVGSADWITPRFAELAGDMASKVNPQRVRTESPA